MCDVNGMKGGGESKNGLKLRTGHSRLTKERLNNTHVSVQQKDVYTTTVRELGGLFNVVQGAAPDEVQIRLNLRSVHAKKRMTIKIKWEGERKHPLFPTFKQH